MAKTPLVHQSEAHECGLACLAMVYATYVREADLGALRRRFMIGQQGLNLQSLRSFAADLGFAHRALRAEPADLRRLRLPAILHWDLNHFVVLVRAGARGCVLHDPARGRLKLGWAQVGKHFTGVVLELWPGQGVIELARSAPRLRIRDLWARARGHTPGMWWILTLSLILQILLLLGPWHVQWSVDKALVSGDAHLLSVLALGFGFLLLLRTLTYWVRGSLVVRLGHGMAFALGSGLLRHLLTLPVSWFAKRHSGDVISRFGSLGPVRDLFTTGAATLVVDGVMVVLSLIAMAVYSLALTGIVVTANALFCWVYLALVPRLRRASMSAVVAQAEEQAHLLESTRAIQSVKVYGHEAARLNGWQELHVNTLAHGMTLQRTQLGAGSVGLFCAGAELTLVIYLGAHAVLDQLFTIGMLFAFLSYRGHFSDRLQSSIEQFVRIRALRVHLDRLADIWFAATESPQGSMRGAPRDEKIKPFNLKDVSMRYAQDSPMVLANVDLLVDASEFVAIVGASGSGKSTLLQLMMGLLPASSGEIFVGDHVMNVATRAHFRGQIACVLQEDGFFAGSVADNLALFETPDVGRVDEVLQMVGMSSVLQQLPMGYATPVGDIASGFSSGEMQRLMLARALYQQPDYLFLDEGTANLDVVTSRAIKDLVARLRCTRVVVTHDLDFASAADKVYELREGRLVAFALPAKG